MALTATGADLASLQRRRARTFFTAATPKLLDRLVSVWMFAGGLVLVEPSPYEFMFGVVLIVSIFARQRIFRESAVLFLLAVAMAPFAITAAFQAHFTPPSTTLVYAAVTVFLMLTAFFLGSYVAEAPQERMRRIVNAYTLIAVFSAIIGTLGYLHLIPGAYDLLTRSQRAKALFKDPNVYGPFLILPAIFAVQRVLLKRDRKTLIVNGAIILALLIGVFVSFSRAAWGNLLGSTVLLFLLTYLLEANGRDKVRMLILAMMGGVMAITALAGLLSIPQVGALFTERASVEQSYDSGDTGRFGRQGYAFDVGLSNPLGIGPAEFHNLKIVEEAHDSFATTLHVYGWGGALVWDALMFMTLYRGVVTLWRRSPNRRLLIPLIAVYIPLVVESAIIDIDHWRYFYLLCGLIWGVTTGYSRLQPSETKLTAVV